LLRNRWEWSGDPNERDVIFRETTIRGKEIDRREYNVIFGKAVFDLTDMDSTDLPKTVQINTIFGGSEVIVDSELPFVVSGDAVFAGAKLDTDNATVFGELDHRSKKFRPDSNHLHIKADVVFGAFEVKIAR
jgi:hypothetical protein